MKILTDLKGRESFVPEKIWNRCLKAKELLDVICSSNWEKLYIDLPWWSILLASPEKIENIELLDWFNSVISLNNILQTNSQFYLAKFFPKENKKRSEELRLLLS